jgi:hypothetical protein
MHDLRILTIRMRQNRITFVQIFATPMYSKNWQVIKDDVKRTYEVCGQESSTNSFTNKVHAMQKDGMNVSGITPPVTNRTSSKEMIKITGYTVENGLYDRLLKEHLAITMKDSESWEGEDGN